MARKMSIAGKRVPRGKRMKLGKGWRLRSLLGYHFKATLLTTARVGDDRIAVFRVLP